MTFSPNPNLEREDRLKVELITEGQWFNQFCLHNETSTKTPQWKCSESFWVHGHIHVKGEWHTPTLRDRGSCMWDPFRPHPVTSSGCSFVSLIINYNGKYTTFLSYMSHSSKLLNRSGTMGSCDFAAKLDRCVGNLGTQYLWLKFEVKAILWHCGVP